ncbi:MAG: hypothetical protein A2381_01505 [Bdellovibrionales bacterium RIFOXYB1_FULL_37_110]|nr:MAG: hypothetical protein A2417_02360 [Bdellovibrionales bacterium RIFOXYC1_FULL_37_79]OFZ58892.1 MAG: hypothetical protein A2381_01505 [Bdellovibrionales bacterium RIFOXYB1_FULL_37_110]OFZ64662.1 MAG: hypothetical protein A2577_13430 [Bdellovibrionales bacterium RIFOXYD1_FULL_36_51]
MKEKLSVKEILVKKIDEKLKAQMFDLFREYYDDVSKEQFVFDLSEKTHVLFIFNKKTGKVIGFSTILQEKLKTKEQTITALFSGDTVVHRDYWGSKALQVAFFFYILKTRLLYFWRPLYWFLISKGHKTYLMMINNFKEAYPHRERPTPDHITNILNEFYERKYRSDFKKDQGIIKFISSKGAVKQNFATISHRDELNPDVQYFLRMNPDYQKGVELACVCRISVTDFLFHLKKYFLTSRKKESLHRSYFNSRN